MKLCLVIGGQVSNQFGVAISESFTVTFPTGAAF